MLHAMPPDMNAIMSPKHELYKYVSCRPPTPSFEFATSDDSTSKIFEIQPKENAGNKEMHNYVFKRS